MELCCARKRGKRKCELPRNRGVADLRSLVREFQEGCEPYLKAEYSLYEEHESLEEAARCAADPEHSHVRAYWRSSVYKAREELGKKLKAIEGAETFDDLYERIGTIIRPIRGVGDLTTYDIAHRIGLYLSKRDNNPKLLPSHVYLHAGTKEGARFLGVKGKRKVGKSEFGFKELNSLSAQFLEDFLCIYKGQLKSLYCCGLLQPNLRP
jgi:hypothetical protein